MLDGRVPAHPAAAPVDGQPVEGGGGEGGDGGGDVQQQVRLVGQGPGRGRGRGARGSWAAALLLLPPERLPGADRRWVRRAAPGRCARAGWLPGLQRQAVHWQGPAPTCAVMAAPSSMAAAKAMYATWVNMASQRGRSLLGGTFWAVMVLMKSRKQAARKSSSARGGAKWLVTCRQQRRRRRQQRLSQTCARGCRRLRAGHPPDVWDPGCPTPSTARVAWGVARHRAC